MEAAHERLRDVGSSSFDDFYRAEYSSVVGLAYAMTGNRWVAEDLAQDAFIAAQRSWDKISEYEQPGAWVRRVLANRSISRFRRLRTEKSALPRLAAGEANTSLPDISTHADEIWELVRRLPKRQAQVTALTFVDGCSLQEIGEILECSPFTAKTHLQRAKAALAEQLGAERGDRS